MNGPNRDVTYFEDRIRLTGFRSCSNQEHAIRSNAASLMHSAHDSRTSAVLKLICLNDSIVFTPPLYINNIYHRQSILHKNIIGFFLAPNYNTRLVLVVKEGSTVINLYGIQLSSAQKAQEITSLLGETRPQNDAITNNAARSPTYSVSTSVNNSVPLDPTVQVNIPIMAKSTIPYNSSSSPTPIRSEYKRGGFPDSTTRASPVFALRSQSQNGSTLPFTENSSMASSRVQTKFPGIISSAIEYDWDDVLASQTKLIDDLDERISIGYYNDDGENDDSPRLSPKEMNSEKERLTPNSQNAWMENITYISNHPTKGSHVTANGSVYMYVAQQVNPRTGNST